MSIECTHCGAVNPTDSMFCGECGWQIIQQEAEKEIAEFIAARPREVDPDVVKARREAEPAGDEAEPEPEAIVPGKEPETGLADREELPGEQMAGGEPELEPETVAPSLEPESGPDEIVEPAGEDAAGVEPDLGPETAFIEVESGTGRDGLEDLPEEDPAPGRVELEPAPFDAGAGPGSRLDAVDEPTSVPFPSPEMYFQDGEGVTITSSAAVFGDRVYAWPEIISTSMEIHPASRWPSLLLAAFGAILLAFAVASLGRGSQLGLILIAGGFALLAIG
mgnify:CR=1 FL=1